MQSSDAEENGDDEQEEIEEEPEQTHAADPSAVFKTQAETIFKVIMDLKEAGHLAKRQLTLDLVASTLVGRFEIDTEEYAQDLLALRGDAVLELMDEAKTNAFDWSRKVIYRELKAAAKKNQAKQVALTPLRPRMSANQESSTEDSDQDEEDEDDPRARRRRVRKSVLRPKSSVATKQTGKRTRSTAAADEEDMSDEHNNADAMDEFETPSKVRGHDLVRDPLSTRAKRRTRSILSDSGSMSFAKTPLQETLQSRNTSVSVADQDPPDRDIHGDGLPSDTWVCQVPDCGKIIQKSNTKRGQEMIRDHSLGHADDTKAKLDLVFAEQRLNIGLPVDNLLSRIREMGTGTGTVDGAMLAALAGGTNGNGSLET